ncbi:conjugal transfer protein [Metallosphaera javensis (ex Hofmann et al. 2022)]|uniref:conjugal transfer protein n=1 Tax=Metallosphaera javensis (ex Hofmann et al. 2022) TaxID=99938 RepID=UPI001EDE6EA1|nr:conjugal transfer protein [Metallosphaera javensis (ex Hofmann et al. 2022)]
MRVAEDMHAEVTATKIQKIFFLLQMEGGKNVGLKFEPYLFGPYSEELNETIIELVERGVIEETAEPLVDPFTGLSLGYKRRFKLKERTNVKVEPEVEKFFAQWVTRDRREILNYVYRKYPDYTRYSVIREKVFGVRNGL